jgi:hypothetical protein
MRNIVLATCAGMAAIFAAAFVIVLLNPVADPNLAGLLFVVGGPFVAAWSHDRLTRPRK